MSGKAQADQWADADWRQEARERCEKAKRDWVLPDGKTPFISLLDAPTSVRIFLSEAFLDFPRALDALNAAAEEIAQWHEIEQEYLKTVESQQATIAKLTQERDEARQSYNDASAVIVEYNCDWHPMKEHAEKAEAELAQARRELDQVDALLFHIDRCSPQTTAWLFNGSEVRDVFLAALKRARLVSPSQPPTRMETE